MAAGGECRDEEQQPDDADDDGDDLHRRGRPHLGVERPLPGPPGDEQTVAAASGLDPGRRDLDDTQHADGGEGEAEQRGEDAHEYAHGILLRVRSGRGRLSAAAVVAGDRAARSR
ncbi:hypothetical protein TOK_4906 [Pseudonocardia sp. N23]|nr:hypothetical protein TOK_4906 [Pseudonocardia sp. N23]